MHEPFEPVIRAHGATVMRVCLAVLAGCGGATHDADDAWAETFVAALRAWPGLDADANVEAWLVRIAQRKAVDVLRARSRRREDPVGDDHPVAADCDPAASSEAAEIWTHVARLPDRQREAIGYHYLGGLTHVQTAELTGSTPAAVRRAAADGIAALRRRLDSEGVGTGHLAENGASS